MKLRSVPVVRMASKGEDPSRRANVNKLGTTFFWRELVAVHKTKPSFLHTEGITIFSLVLSDLKIYD